MPLLLGVAALDAAGQLMRLGARSSWATASSSMDTAVGDTADLSKGDVRTLALWLDDDADASESDNEVRTAAP